MLGCHCIKTWSASQGPYALSSGEAELYAMVEGVTRAKGLLCLAWELGFKGLENVIQMGTDSSAARSFVHRRGLGRMRHLQLRDFWLQKEVREGRLIVEKIPGEENPADLMTKVLSLKEVESRLRGMNLRMVGKRCEVDVCHVKKGELEFDVSEVFSPPRSVQWADEYGLRPGFSLDVKHVDGVTGKKWDFLQDERRCELKRLLKRRRSKVIVVSPPCTKFSTLQGLRERGVPECEWEEACFIRVGR